MSMIAELDDKIGAQTVILPIIYTWMLQIGDESDIMYPT
jgi:hypothetical protein